MSNVLTMVAAHEVVFRIKGGHIWRKVFANCMRNTFIRMTMIKFTLGANTIHDRRHASTNNWAASDISLELLTK
jgi:hypothetical protein